MDTDKRRVREVLMCPVFGDPARDTLAGGLELVSARRQAAGFQPWQPSAPDRLAPAGWVAGRSKREFLTDRFLSVDSEHPVLRADCCFDSYYPSLGLIT